MNDLLKKIKQEWEIASLCAAVIVVLLVVAIGLFSSSENAIGSGGGMGIWKAPKLINDSGFAFVEQQEPAALESSRPFSLPQSLRPPKRQIVIAPKVAAPTKYQEPEPAPQPAVAPPPPVVEPAPVAKPEPPKPAPPIIAGTMYYAESQEMADGTYVAVFDVTRYGRPREVVTLAKGETKFGVKLVSVTDEEALLLDARRNRVLLRHGKEKKLWATGE